MMDAHDDYSPSAWYGPDDARLREAPTAVCDRDHAGLEPTRRIEVPRRLHPAIREALEQRVAG